MSSLGVLSQLIRAGTVHLIMCGMTGGGLAPPAVVYYASSDRRGAHPQKHLAAFAAILQADCYSGFEPLFDPQKKAMPITPAFCFAHPRQYCRSRVLPSRASRRSDEQKPRSRPLSGRNVPAPVDRPQTRYERGEFARIHAALTNAATLFWLGHRRPPLVAIKTAKETSNYAESEPSGFGVSY